MCPRDVSGSGMKGGAAGDPQLHDVCVVEEELHRRGQREVRALSARVPGVDS